MKIDAECNESIPSISFDRFHEDFKILTEMTSNAEQHLQHPCEAWMGAKHSPNKNLLEIMKF